jgi:hypothetical protein
MEEMINESIIILIMFSDMFGLTSIWLKIIQYYQMMPVATVLTLIGASIAIIWIIKELSKTKPIFNPKAIDTIVNEQKAITKGAKSEDVL